jgi:RNA polymerase sigma-70 factor (ECF subfamily)
VADATDWTEIVALYGVLQAMSPSPVVELNRAVAISMADGPGAGLAAVEQIVESGRLDQSHLLHATRAALLWRMGRLADAAAAYRRALALAGTGTERRFLEQRLAALDAPTGPQGPSG